MTDVRCPTCHRHATWDEDGTEVSVRVEGGARRPDHVAEAVRMRVALTAWFGGEVVVGDCPACGMPMVADRGARSAVEVSAAGVTVSADGIRGQAFDDVDAARAWVHETWPPPRETSASDVAKLPFFLVLLPILVGWIFAGVFVWSFLASIYEGAPAAVQGAAGFDRTSADEVPADRR